MKAIGYLGLLLCMLGCGRLQAETSSPNPGADVGAALNLDLPGLEATRSALARQDAAATEAAYLAYRRHASPALYFVMPKDQPAQAVATSDGPGDEVCRHFIRNTYGFQPLSADMGKDFNWTYNPVPPTSPDFTKEWTFCAVSRMGFWRALADAYWNTRDEKYAREWVAELQDFAAKNPVNLAQRPDASALWRTLDASIRMSDSWPYAYAHFLNSTSFTPEAHWLYLKLIYDHALRLKNGLEDSQRAGNWVISECNGLYTIGALFPEFKDAVAWRALAMNRMIAELQRSVAPDGFESELTPNYHYFSLSSFIGPYRLGTLNHLPIPAEFQSKILAMYKAPVWVMDQAGNVVPTNDSHTISAASKAREGLSVLGDDPLLRWAATGGKEGTAPPESTMLRYAGFYAMRGGWQRNDLFLFFRGGPAGIGHEHEDMLEVVLRAWNKTLLLDPGSYPYDSSDWRRYVIGAASHNTIIVDGKWQHSGPTPAPLTTPVNNPWVTSPAFDFVAATYDAGYQQNEYDPTRSFLPQKWVGPVDRSVTHTRRVLFFKPYYALVIDSLSGTGTHTFDAHFHMDVAGARMDGPSQAVFSNDVGKAQLALYPLDRDHLQTEIIQGQKDPLLGWMPVQHRAIPTVRFRKVQDAPAQFATFLYPYYGKSEDAPAFSAEPLRIEGRETNDVWAQSLRTPHEEADVALRLASKPDVLSARSHLAGAFRARASGIVIRQSTQDHVTTYGAFDLTEYQNQHCSFALAAPGALLWQQRSGGMLVYNAGAHPVEINVSKPWRVQATLQPARWMTLSSQGTVPAETAPVLFAPVSVTSDAPRYSDYLKQNASMAVASATATRRISAESMTIPKSAAMRQKVGAEGKVISGWDEAQSMISAPVPAAGWYRIRLRYCAQGNPVRTLLVNGQVPFAEAEGIELFSTQGAPPSDGWSNATSDWKEIMLGDAAVSGGWRIYLPPGEISLRNDSGGGANIAWIELIAAPAGS